MKTPAANRKVLAMTAGLLWSAVGVVLIAVACFWIHTYSGNWPLSLAVGFALGAAIYRFQFVTT